MTKNDKQQTLFSMEVVKKTPHSPICLIKRSEKSKRIVVEECVVIVDTLFITSPITGKRVEYGIGEVAKIESKEAYKLASMSQVKVLPGPLLRLAKH